MAKNLKAYLFVFDLADKNIYSEDQFYIFQIV